jgi:hypothetical protein
MDPAAIQRLQRLERVRSAVLVCLPCGIAHALTVVSPLEGGNYARTAIWDLLVEGVIVTTRGNQISQRGAVNGLR